MVTLEREESASLILEGLRAVANTKCPRLARARARAEPMPPEEQPVMRIVLGGILIFDFFQTNFVGWLVVGRW